MTPLVAIFIMTYNHEKYIGQAIEGALAQKTTFSTKLFIGEDCSTDTTRAICVAYRDKYPDKIELILQERNAGIWPNFFATHKACIGSGAEYIALCEGDDHWTSPNKLQKQVDYLRSQANCAACFHAAEISYVDGAVPNHVVKPSRVPAGNQYTINDVLRRKGRFFTTASVMFRADAVKEFPGWFYDAPMGDYPLMILASTNGEIGYIDDVMCVYRAHVKDSWTVTFGMHLTELADYRARSLKYLSGFNIVTNNMYRKEVALMIKAANYSYLSGLVRCSPKSKQCAELLKLVGQLEVVQIAKILFKIICPEQLYGRIKRSCIKRGPF